MKPYEPIFPERKKFTEYLADLDERLRREHFPDADGPFLAGIRVTLLVEDYVINIYSGGGEAQRLLTEAKHRGIPLGGQYSAQRHGPHTPKGQHHLHVYAKNNELFAINKDGTAHDDSHGAQIPSKVHRSLRNLFPDYNIPSNGFLESADGVLPPDAQVLLG